MNPHSLYDRKTIHFDTSKGQAMKRYDVGLGVGHGGYSIDVSPTGDWVLHADAQERIVALEKAYSTLAVEVMAWRKWKSEYHAAALTWTTQDLAEARSATDAHLLRNGELMSAKEINP
jgi:hypothetical protein